MKILGIETSCDDTCPEPEFFNTVQGYPASCYVLVRGGANQSEARFTPTLNRVAKRLWFRVRLL